MSIDDFPPEALRQINARVTVMMKALSPEDQAIALKWINETFTSGDDVRLGLVEMILNGDAVISRIEHGKPRFRVTEAGMVHAAELLDTDEGRATFSKVLGRPVAPGSKATN